jgi:hypothetical protein
VQTHHQFSRMLFESRKLKPNLSFFRGNSLGGGGMVNRRIPGSNMAVVVKSEPPSENDPISPGSRSPLSPTSSYISRRPREKDGLDGGDPKRVRLDANHNDRWR